jgi:hypothetical protein
MQSVAQFLHKGAQELQGPVVEEFPGNCPRYKALVGAAYPADDLLI